MDDEARRKKRRETKRARDEYLRKHWPERWEEQRERRRKSRLQSEATPEQQEARRKQWRDYHHKHAAEINDRKRPREQQRRADDTDGYRETARRYRDANRDKINAAAKQYRQEHADDVNRRARERRQRANRLRELNLPPKILHRTSAAEKHTNTVNAAAFFGRSRDDITSRFSSDEQAVVEQQRARYRFLASRAPVPPEMLARFKAQAAAHRERYEEFELAVRLDSIVRERGGAHEARIRQELAIDQAARKVNGKPPLDTEREVRVRVAAAVLEHDLHQQERAIYQRLVGRQAGLREAELQEIRERFKEAPVILDLKQRMPRIIAANRARHEAGVREQVEQEAARRSRVGANPIDVEREIDKRVAAQVIQHDLTPRDRKLLDTLREATEAQQRGGSDPGGGGGRVHVRPHMRNGRPVRGHSRDT